MPSLANLALRCEASPHHNLAAASVGTRVPSQRVVSLSVKVTLYPDAPAKLGSSCSGVLPSWNILLIVASDGLLITGAMYVLWNA